MPSRRPHRPRRPSPRRRRWPLLVVLGAGAAFLASRFVPRPLGTPPAPVAPTATQPAPVAAPVTKAPRSVPAPAVTFVPPPAPVEETHTTYPRPVRSWLEAQIELSRRYFSCGPIDGIGGAQTGAALRAFQESVGVPVTGQLDTATVAVLQVTAPLHTTYVVAAEDLAGLQPLSPTWLGKSQQSALAYETILELVAERTHANPKYVQALNPGIAWTDVAAGTALQVPAVRRTRPEPPAAHLHIRLADRVLQVRDHGGRLIAHCPVSIARNVDKRPVGELRVTVVVPDPNYTFNPEVFPESAEARELGRKLILAPGPNNPVGAAWIGLNLPGYGIHGTPHPEQVGRTESHGCFRLANWDARTLLQLAWVGLPVFVDP